MPIVNCPGCQTALSIDPFAASEFECPQCGQILRLKNPARAAVPAAAKPQSTDRYGLPKPNDDFNDPPPVHRKNKKRSRGPSGEVSPLLVPLGGLAVLLLLAVSLFNLNREAKAENVQIGPFAYAVTFFASLIGLSFGGLITRFAVNSFARRKRVPELEFSEAVCLYPLVAFLGVIGAGLLMIPALSMFGKPPPGPGVDDAIGMKIFVGCVAALIGFIAAGSTAIKYLLNTRWNDAASICARFVLVFIVTIVGLNFLLVALIVAVKG